MCQAMKAMNSLVVLNAEGEAISVPTLWQKRRIILVFLRHFGCRFCKQQVRTMKVVQLRLKEAGTEVVLVSLGTPDQIERYRKELDIPACIEVYVDPEPDAPVAYAAFKLQSGRNLVLEHARVAELGSHALAEGNTDGGYASPTGPYTGSVFQVGGVFVLGAGNVCDYAYRSSYAGDHPNAAALLEAAAGITTHGMEYTYPTTTAWLERLSASRLATKATARASSTPSLVSVGVVLGMLGTLGLALGAAAILSGMRAPPLPPPPPLSSAARLWLSSLTRLFPPPPPMPLPPPPPPAWRLLPNTPLGSPLATGRTSPLRVVLAALSAVLAFMIFASLGCLRVGTARAARRSGGGGRCPALPSAVSVRLLTPSEVDAYAIERQMMDCDCGRVTDGTDMQRPSEVFSQEELIGIDTLATLDTLRALPYTTHAVQQLNVPGGLTNSALYQLRLTNCYLREFLSKPHPLLGRPGPTCPFVPKALKLDSMRVGVVNSGAHPAPEAMQQLVRGFIPVFEGLHPTGGPTAVFKAILLLFPDVPLDAAREVIDGTQLALKEEFVAQGLMLGEFHLANNSRGLRNAEFYPLRTVCPTLAIRHMVPQDLVFLTGEQYSDEKRKAFLQSYVKRMGDAKGEKAQSDIHVARELLKTLVERTSEDTSVGTKMMNCVERSGGGEDIRSSSEVKR